MRRVYLSLFCALLLFASCTSSSDDEVYCTLVFKIISVEIQGGELTSYYTIQESTQDTLFLEEFNYEFFNSYPILTDGQFDLFEEEAIQNFRFIGFIDDEMKVNEPYRIGADRCHVFLEEGRTFIDLDEE